MPKKEKKISLVSNTFSAKKKTITPANILKIKNQKLVLILATFILVIIIRKKFTRNVETGENDKRGENSKNSKNGEKDENLGTNLAWVLYIWYLSIFQKQSVLILFDLKNEVNAIYLTFTKELSFFIRPISIETQKIESTILDTYKMIIANFLVTDKTNQVRFFEKPFW